MLFESFADEMQKIAFGPKAMGRVLKHFKGRSHRIGDKVQHPVTGQGMGYGYVLPTDTRKGKKHVSSMIQKVHETYPEVPIDEIKRQVAAQSADVSSWGSTMFSPGKGDAKKFFGKTMGEVSAPQKVQKAIGAVKTPEQRKAMEAVMKGHEVAESQVKPTSSFLGFGHLSPDVILREHNMITTLPESAAPVRKAVMAIRGLGEAPALKAGTGFEFGKGQRISRHARKHLTKMYEKALTETPEKIQQGIFDALRSQ